MVEMHEKRVYGIPGGIMFFLLLLAIAAGGSVARGGAVTGDPVVAIAGGGVVFLSLFLLTGLVVVNPNQAVVLQLFGRYVGTLREQGMRWVNPFNTKSRVSLRVTSFDSARLKVNDHGGNPIEVGAIVVMRVNDTAKAFFQVTDYNAFVRTQVEAALRNLVSRYPYDGDEGQLSLRANTVEFAELLKTELVSHVGAAGVEILDTKISHLAYAPEIAQAMLQRQQASAIVAARRLIVEGAVGMVEMALEMLSKQHIVELDEERKAQMVSNLLVVLCGERGTQPVVNTGTIYQ